MINIETTIGPGLNDPAARCYKPRSRFTITWNGGSRNVITNRCWFAVGLEWSKFLSLESFQFSVVFD